MHGLDADAGALGGEVDGGAGGAFGGEVGVAGCGCAGDVGAVGVGGGGVVLAVALVGELGLAVHASLALIDGFVGGGLGGFGVARCGATSGVAAGDYAVDGDGTRRSGDGVIGMVGEDKRLGGGVDCEDGAAAFQVEGVGLLIGRQERTINQNTAINKVETPAARALKHACHHWSGRRSFVGTGQDLTDHLAKGAQERVARASGRKSPGADATAHCAFLGVLGRSRLLLQAGSLGLRTAGVGLVVDLGVGLRYVGVVDLLLLFLESSGCSKFLRGGLGACREELLQCATGHVRVLH